jgi:sugar phosphate isomerase/epimerase
MSQHSRRGFLGGLASATAVAPYLAAADSGAVAAGDLKVGIASYSLRAFSRRTAIRMAKLMGAQYINIKDVHLAMGPADEVAKGAEEFRRAGLTITGGGTIYFLKTDEADIKAKFDYAKAAGMPLIVAGPTADTLPILERYAKQYDIKIAVHNHGPEDKHYPNPQVALDQMKKMDPRMGVCVDVGHAVRTGVDIVETVRMCGSRLLDMHIKDLANLSETKSQVPVGDGKMPIVAIFRELKKMKYQGGIMLEYEIDEDNPVPGMHRSMAYMRGVLAGMRA